MAMPTLGAWQTATMVVVVVTAAAVAQVPFRSSAQLFWGNLLVWQD